MQEDFETPVPAPEAQTETTPAPEIVPEVAEPQTENAESAENTESTESMENTEELPDEDGGEGAGEENAPHSKKRLFIVLAAVLAGGLMLAAGYFGYQKYLSPRARFFAAAEELAAYYLEPVEDSLEELTEKDGLLTDIAGCESGSVKAELTVSHGGEEKQENWELTVTPSGKRLTLSDKDKTAMSAEMTPTGITVTGEGGKTALSARNLSDSLGLELGELQRLALFSGGSLTAWEQLSADCAGQLRSGWFSVGSSTYNQEKCTAYQLKMSKSQRTVFLRGVLASLLREDAQTALAAQETLLTLFDIAQADTVAGTVQNALNELDRIPEAALTAVIYVQDSSPVALVLSTEWNGEDLTLKLTRSGEKNNITTAVSARLPLFLVTETGLREQTALVCETSFAATGREEDQAWKGTAKFGLDGELTETMPFSVTFADGLPREITLSTKTETGNTGSFEAHWDKNTLRAAYEFYSAENALTTRIAFDGTLALGEEKLSLAGDLTQEATYDEALLAYYGISPEEANTAESHAVTLEVRRGDGQTKVSLSYLDADGNGLTGEMTLKKAKNRVGTITLTGTWRQEKEEYRVSARGSYDFRAAVKKVAAFSQKEESASDTAFDAIIEDWRTRSRDSLLLGYFYEEMMDRLYEHEYFSTEEQPETAEVPSLAFVTYESVRLGDNASVLPGVTGVTQQGTLQRYYGQTVYSYATPAAFTEEGNGRVFQVACDETGSIIFKGFRDDETIARGDALKDVKKSKITEGMTREDLLHTLARAPYYAITEEDAGHTVEQMYFGYRDETVLLALTLRDGVVTEIVWQK